MLQIKNDRVLRALAQKPVDITPIWLMRQAGRYLPEYRKVRKKAGSFIQLCTHPELACEVTLQPLRRYPLDAAIIFSDILTIPDAMGLGLFFTEGKGPAFKQPVTTQRQIESLPIVPSDQLEYVYQAIRFVKKELNQSVPLIGFCGSPWTLAAYTVQGESKPGFPKVMEMIQNGHDYLHLLLEKLMLSVCNHLIGQVKAGVDVLMLFDTWGGLLETQLYENFSLFYTRQILQRLREHYNITIPVILFTKQGNKWLQQMADSGCTAIGLDWTINIAKARQEIKGRTALQGNLNPAVLLQAPEEIRKAAQEIIVSYGKGGGHIFNLGHGVTPDVPPENVAILVDSVHEFSEYFHKNAEDDYAGSF